jgi:hypothetical protein
MVSLEWNNNFDHRLKTTIFNIEMDNVRPLLGELLYLYFLLMELSFMYSIHISASRSSTLLLANIVTVLQYLLSSSPVRMSRFYPILPCSNPSN